MTPAFPRYNVVVEGRHEPAITSLPLPLFPALKTISSTQHPIFVRRVPVHHSDRHGQLLVITPQDKAQQKTSETGETGLIG